MPIAVHCPECNAKLNAPDSAAGKTVTCPKCKEAMVIPEIEEEAEEEAAPPKRTKAEDKPVVKKKKAVVEDDDDEEEERPRKKKKGKKKTAKSGLSPVLIGAIAGGVLLLGGGAFAAYWFGIREKPKETANSNTTPNQNTPAPGGSGVPGPGPASGKALYEASNPAVAAHRQDSMRKMKQIGIAFLNHSDTYRAIPAGIVDATGKPGLSWRVAILPFIEQESLYRQFKLNEPWDSENNKKLLQYMPRTFTAPGQEPSSGKTYYRAFSGPDTAFHYRPATAGQPLLGRKLNEFQDGTSNTALVLEALEPVEWTKPDELVYVANGPVPKFGGIFASGTHILFADSSVRWARPNLPEKTVRAIITPGGGEIADLDD